ncbi:hypothetical protein BX600DRAFT_509986 [Xylariales sp. PMI_506]|nr:hypothetical protein BX600DRAFT_509986 [Xylariales sp. PMI_506]
MSGLVNKVKEALHSDKSHEAPEGTHGPHGSRVANAADPRVDSDRDHRANPASNIGGTGTYGSAGTTGSYEPGHSRTYEPGRTGTYETAEGVHGPHSSRMANAADPRIDSDRDHRANPASNVGGTGTYGSTGTGNYGSAGTGNYGSAGTGNAFSSTGATEGAYDRRGAPGSTFGASGTGAHLGSGPGPAPKTAGPHKSDMMNKADPRVDSDLDGSKTFGGNKTFGASSTARDPTDAAQVPPSVMRKHIGDPSIMHGDASHQRDRRNSQASAQDIHRGL